MNIVFVCLEDDYAIKFGKEIAQLINFSFVNFDDIFGNILLKTKDELLFSDNPILEKKETDEIKEILSKDKQVVSISNNSFLSNRNYELFKEDVTILIEIKENDKIEKNIQKLIKKYCKIAIKQEKIDLFKRKNKIIDILNNK